jgi:uncharacterized protein YkwD
MTPFVERLRWLAVLLATAFVATAPAWAGPSGGARQLTAAPSLDVGLLSAVNDIRAERGLRPVRLSPQLSAAARLHSMEMANSGSFRHESPNGEAFWKRIKRFYDSKGFRTWSVGENILWASPDVTSSGAVELWLDSPRHREILLSPRWSEVGLSAVHAMSAPGEFEGLEVTIVTADFGARSRR